jgi:hypothetical protein
LPWGKTFDSELMGALSPNPHAGFLAFARAPRKHRVP